MTLPIQLTVEVVFEDLEKAIEPSSLWGKVTENCVLAQAILRRFPECTVRVGHTLCEISGQSSCYITKQENLIGFEQPEKRGRNSSKELLPTKVV